MPLRDDRASIWALWLLIAFGAIQPIAWVMAARFGERPLVLLLLLAVWIVLLVLAALATRRIGALWQRLTTGERAHSEAVGELEQLQAQNAVLEIIARSVDVALAFQALAKRIARIVPCDRIGLALLSEDGREFQTYTVRVHEDERRARPRQEVVFRIDRTIIGTVVRSGEPLILDNIQDAAPDYLDANVLLTAGFRSGLIMPLVSKGRAVGTLNMVSRTVGAFQTAHIEAVRSIAEILGVAWVAQQLHMSLGKYRTMEAMAELTLSVSTEINSALQTIIGHCGLLERSYPDSSIRRDLGTIVTQAQRIAGLLDRMRTSAQDRFRQVAETMHQGGIPTSPEAFGDREIT